MHHFLWLEWERFYAAEPSPEPLIITRGKTVLDANVAAQKTGVEPGMELRQARMLCRTCAVREWQREEYVERQKAWLDICAEYTGIVEPIDQHTAALDVTEHPGRIEIVERLVRSLLNSVRLPLRYGVAPSKWIAKLAADRQDIGLASQDPERFLTGLSVDKLLPVQAEHRKRLKFLGYDTIGDVRAIPLGVLKSQFDEAGLTIYKAARGGCFQPVYALYPLDSLRECFLFEPSVNDWSTIQDVLLVLSERLGRRLQDRQSSTLELSVEKEDGAATTRKRRFTKPIVNALTARAALRILFPASEDDRGITALRVTLTDLEPVRHRQARLIESGIRPSTASAIHYIQNTFGEDAIRLAGEVVRPRRERVLNEWRRAVGWQ